MLQTFQELLGTTSLPTQKELEAAADAILTIQTVYDLPAKDIAAGNMHPDFPSAELTMTQCAELAQRAAIVTPHLATPWKGAAMEQLLKQKADLLDDEEKKQVQLAARVFNQNPDLFIMKQAHVSAREELEAEEDCDEELPEEALQKQQEKETREMFQQYKELCSGQASQAVKSSRLKCRLKGGASTLRTHPSLVLAPAREEELSSSPSILHFHDVLSPKEAQELVEHSRPQMAPLDSNDGIIATAAMTRSPKLSLRLKQTIEGLPITADEYQILHYGLGGVDASGKIEIDDLHSPSRSIFHVGNASTGMILYLGDVAIGGETVFPKLGVVVPAIQGSVLFWENRDPRTPHALCPVVVGDHWELENLCPELQK
ncbi:unnamed protein product [Cyprideis torosa]|uniref:Prolyl 4-hydroxylase alpha subunit domain-containing protein n=1 Tax=Cyprideis torosa TaxID=163714 RepID=A0A7R8WEX1_9CRUS|nr:unnamed protein product [Cyprideis torosa]CAG0890011.1 unnamed protein product [Cyprideis torosa]